MSFTAYLPCYLTKRTHKIVKIKDSPLLVDRFRCSLRVCCLEFDKNVIYDVVYRQPPIIYRQNAKNRYN